MKYLDDISREPLEAMIRKNKDEFLYIPLSIVQAELRLIYGGMTKWEMVEVGGNKEVIWGYGKLHYKIPNGEWLFQTGTASLPVSNKMRLIYPSLESHCILNAAKKIGPWFGQNLNRDKEDEMAEEVPVVQVTEDVLDEQIKKSKSLIELGLTKDQALSSTKLRAAYMKRARELHELEIKTIK